MQNFVFKCSELTPNCNNKNHYLMEKTAKNYFDDFSVVNVCVLQY